MNMCMQTINRVGIHSYVYGTLKDEGMNIFTFFSYISMQKNNLKKETKLFCKYLRYAYLDMVETLKKREKKLFLIVNLYYCRLFYLYTINARVILFEKYPMKAG